MNRFLTTSALACAAAFAPTSGIGEDQPVQAEVFAADRAAATIYSVANLGTGWPTELPRINNRGQVAFSVRNFNPRNDLGYRALFYDGATVHDIGNVGINRSFATALNDAGVVVGRSQYCESDFLEACMHAFRWSAGKGIADLGTLAGRDTTPWQINNRGVAVGRSLLSNRQSHAFSWTRGRGMADLNKRLAAVPNGMVIEDALGVGNDGTIVAMSNAGLVVLKPGPARDAAPLVGPMVNATSVRLNSPLRAVIHFLDIQRADTHQGSWDWGDGSKLEPATLRERNGAGTATGSHTYHEGGDYVVVLTVTDSGGRKSSSVTLVSICDPAGDANCRR
jgi:probable HAF family extracellular repeat protein